MVVVEKPTLDEDLLMHFGIKGMRWGHRKPQPSATGETSGMSTRKKVVIGVSVAAGVAAGAYLLSKRGALPKTKAFESKANRIGFKIAGKVLARVGKTSVKVVTKTAKLSSKVGVKTVTVTGKLGAKITTNVSKATGRNVVSKSKKAGEAIVGTYRKVQVRRALRNSPVTVKSGSRMAQLLMGRIGSAKTP